MQKKKQNILFTELQLIYQFSQEIFLLFNRDGEIVDCNQAAKKELGYAEDIYQVSIVNIFRKAMRKDKDELIVNLRYRNYTAETFAYRKNQTCFPVTLRVALWPYNTKIYGLCTAVNISDKKEAFREIKRLRNDLKSTNQFKNEFIANITHELRTPVNGIIGLTNLLLETSLQPNQLDAVNMMRSSCSKMETIINNVLDYSKLASNKMVLEQKEFEFPNFIDHIVSIHSSSINEKGLKLNVNVADDIPKRVIGDEYRLTQVLNNIISNAIKFTSVGQIVLEVAKVSQSSQDVELFFMVIDTGIGISREEMDCLFKSFTQVDGSFTRRFGGTGLGLSISKLLIEAMQGTITVESEKDQGSTFSFNVHLGIPEEKEETVVKENFNDNTIVNLYEEDPLDSSEVDYISRILDEAKHYSLNTEEVHMQNVVEDMQEQREVTEILYDRMERLAICIEMESWKKADDYASALKKMLPTGHKELSNKGLSLVLAVRKEDHDQALKVLEELKVMLKEVI